MRMRMLLTMAVVFSITACNTGITSETTQNEAESLYKKGYDCDRKMQHRMAEYYWKTAMAEVANSTKAEDLDIYARSACRLTNLLSVRGEYEAALDVAVPAAQRLDQQHCDSTSDYTNLLVYIGCCKSRFGMSVEEANESYERAYEMHLMNIKKQRTSETYKNAIAGVINIAYNCNETRHYEDALKWTNHYGELISEYEQRNDSNNDYVDKQWARYDIYRAIALEGLGRKEEAAEVFGHFQKTHYSQTPDGQLLGVNYLSFAGRWAEAANGYESLDELLKAHDASYSLETLQDMVLKKYQANKMAGRSDSAIAVSLFISEQLDSAITQTRRLEAEELSAIRNIEAQKAIVQARNAQTRQWVGMTSLALIFAIFTFYTYSRRRARLRLEKMYKELKSSAEQMVADSRSEERTNTERQIALSLQTLLKNGGLPRHNAFDIHSMTESCADVGGDFYDVLLRDGHLLFCIGDGSGCGVGASIAMAMTKALFRSATATESRPDCIVNIINHTLACAEGDKVSSTLFVGSLDLATGNLTYCNAGHLAPLLVGERLERLEVNENAAVGQNANQEYVAQETSLTPGTLLFAYTDGLTEVQNVDHQPFEDSRMMGEALQSVYGHDSAPKPFIERMTATVHRFIGDAELSDDITMLAIRYLKS